MALEKLLLETGDALLQEDGSFVSITEVQPAVGTGDGRGGHPSALPFMQRRVIERTASPSPVYTQVVDQIVRTWLPAAAALLACAVTPATARADVRYEQQPSAAILPLGPQPPATAQTVPAFTDTGRRTSDRPRLDVRGYEWASGLPVNPAVDAIVARWAPAFASALASTRTAADTRSLNVRSFDPQANWIQPTLPAATVGGGSNQPTSTGSVGWFIRRAIERTTGPQAVYAATLPAGGPSVAQTWPASAETGARTGDRARLGVRAYDWRSGPSSWLKATDASIAQWAPAFAEKGDRSRDRRVVERSAGPQPVYTATLPAGGPTVAQMAPAWTSQAQAFRVTYRRFLFGLVNASDTRGAGTGAGPSPAATVAQTVPAFQTPSERTRDSAKRDLFRAQSIPNIFGVPDDWITWAPQQDDGSGRTRDRVRLDVRAYEWSQPAWIFRNLPAASVTTAQTVPAWTDESRRTVGRLSLDVRSYDWAPRFTWVAKVVDAAVARWIPIVGAELASTRTPARRQDPVTTEPQPAWIFTVLPAVLTPAQQIAAVVEAERSYRTAARVRLDVRGYEWAPEQGWTAKAVDTVVAKWQPIWRLGDRTRDRDRLDVRTLTDTPQPAWIRSVLPVEPWPPATFHPAGLSDGSGFAGLSSGAQGAASAGLSAGAGAAGLSAGLQATGVAGKSTGAEAAATAGLSPSAGSAGLSAGVQASGDAGLDDIS